MSDGHTFTPKYVFFTKGKGVAPRKLASFEKALRDAGIQKYNLVNVSSILPPHAKEVSREAGLEMLHDGQIVFTVLARESTDEPNRLIAASVGVAKPTNPDQYGYLSEHHGFGQTSKKSGDLAEDLAAEMLASTLGVNIDVDEAYNKRKDYYRISNKTIRTKNLTQSAEGDKDGKWTTVVVAAVFVL